MSQYKKIDIDGASIEYEFISGRSDKATIVLLHEGLGCVALWRDFPRKIHAATDCPVLSYSRLGYGGSDPIVLPRPLDHMRKEGRDFLPKIFAALGIESPIVLGHSDGASIALEFAIAHQDALDALIILAPHVFVEEISVTSIRAIDRQFHDSDLRAKLARYHGANVDNAFRGWCDTWLDADFASWNMESELRRIVVPILQFQGTRDEYGSVAHVQSIEARVQSRCRTCILDGCGHAPHLECPERVLTEIADFVQSLET